jgi:hypothetical protein
MTRSLFVLVAIALMGMRFSAADEGAAEEKPGAFGEAAPPQFVKLASVSKDKLSITIYHYDSQPVISFKEETVERDGKVETVRVPITEMTSVLRKSQISMQYVRLFDSKGMEIKGDDSWKRLKPGTTLLRQTAARPIDPSFLKLLSPDAVILAPSIVQAPPAGKLTGRLLPAPTFPG